jgi:hypothetical protein
MKTVITIIDLRFECDGCNGGPSEDRSSCHLGHDMIVVVAFYIVSLEDKLLFLIICCCFVFQELLCYKLFVRTRFEILIL